MSALQFLSSLPALLGLTGFVVYFFLARNRTGDRITLDIINKLRREAPDRLPAGADKIDAAALANVIESDARIRAKVSDQDFQLLRDALRQQFITSLTVYATCGVIFLAGIALFVHMSVRPVPITLSSISVESTDPLAKGLPVDLDDLRVHWSSVGDPEDLNVALEEMDNQRRTAPKTVNSTEGEFVFRPDDYKAILQNRNHGGQNRMRVVVQTAKSVFPSSEFAMHVGTTILAARLDPSRVKIMGMIDNRAIDFYDFEAKLLVWAASPGQSPEPITYGGQVKYGKNDFALDPNLKYDWHSIKLVYFGPDDVRTVRTELLGFE
jgi:hypothetical protein